MPDWPTYQYVGTTPISITSAYSTDTTWGNWVQSSTASTSITVTFAETDQLVWNSWVLTPPYSAQAVQSGIRDECRKKAAARAEEMLVSCLNEEQRGQLGDLGRFSVEASSGRVYWIERGYAGNVRSMGRRYCIHGPLGLPHADQMLMQKLLIETDEEGFLDTANESIDYDPIVVDRAVAA